MRISETCFYGDCIDKSKSGDILVGYVESQLREYFMKKQMVKRNVRKLMDNRVHLCFYMIPSSCARYKRKECK